MADMSKLDPDITPSIKPPLGHTSNLVNPYSLQSWLVATSVICLVVLVLSIAARLFVKGYILKKIQLEDCVYLAKIYRFPLMPDIDVLIFAACGFAAFDGALIYEGRYGQGRHEWDVSISNALRLAAVSKNAHLSLQAQID